MKDLGRGLSYDEYLEMADKEERMVIDELNEQGQLSQSGIDKIIQINSILNIVVFSEPHCKDAATTIPFLLKLGELNNRINIVFYRRNGNEEVLEELSGENKVPTFLLLDKEGEVIRKYVEFPKGVKMELQQVHKDKAQNIIFEMRKGKYNELIQEDLIKFITGYGYQYIKLLVKN